MVALFFEIESDHYNLVEFFGVFEHKIDFVSTFVRDIPQVLAPHRRFSG